MSADTILAFSSATLCAALATGAAFQARRAPSRWAFVAGMAILALERACSGFLFLAASPQAMQNWQTRQLTAMALLPGVWLFFSLSYARGNAEYFLKSWRWILTFILTLPLLLVSLFRGQLIFSTSRIENSPALAFNLGHSGLLLQFVLLIAALMVLLNLERTYRTSVGTVRWRIKFMLMGVSLLAIVQLFTASQALLFRSIIPSLDSLHSGAALLAGLLALRSFFRAGHFELNVYPSHSVLKNSATIFIAGAYLVIVGVFAKAADYLGGDAAFSLKALLVLVAMVGLAVLLQSDRVQLNLRHFISRHFRRPLYDYQSIWHQFSAATASQVGQSEYSRAVVKLLAEIFQTLSVTLWVVEERREELTLAASTSLSDRQARESGLTPTEASLVIRQLRRHPGPLDLGNSREDWAMALRRCHPDFFSRNSQRICLPIVAAGEPQAVVILGDRVGAIKFTLQDLDLLKSIGSHISSGLMNVRLSHRLLLTREHEAFQAMATFFVHDLKNAATTLNLMLRNLPDHFDDPAFREDALRGVAKSVAHINNLISRLSQLRHELKMQSVPSDLNAIISEVLADQETVEGIELEKQLGKLPLISLDKSQIAKVITNLVLNAREAMGTGGRLRVETNLTGAWASAAVTDTGCGMTPEFIAQSLFRPFQTTKKNGLGIGMFQSKMIVEAHGGTFAVESSPGQGTTFRVFLPLLPSPH